MFHAERHKPRRRRHDRPRRRGRRRHLTVVGSLSATARMAACEPRAGPARRAPTGESVAIDPDPVAVPTQTGRRSRPPPPRDRGSHRRPARDRRSAPAPSRTRGLKCCSRYGISSCRTRLRGLPTSTLVASSRHDWFPCGEIRAQLGAGAVEERADDRPAARRDRAEALRVRCRGPAVRARSRPDRRPCAQSPPGPRRAIPSHVAQEPWRDARAATSIDVFASRARAGTSARSTTKWTPSAAARSRQNASSPSPRRRGCRGCRCATASRRRSPC